jgi:hypothetical protein
LNIPVGYRESALTCIAIGKGPPTEWVRKTASGFERTSTRSWSTEYTLISQLAFANGFQATDAGEYTCSTQNKIGGVQLATFRVKVGGTIAIIPPCPMRSEYIFEIRVLNTRCGTWTELEKRFVKLQFVRSLVSILVYHCETCSGSDVSAENLMLAEEIRCNARAASFRGMLVNLPNPEDAFCALNNWRLLGSTIVIEDDFHIVDRHCDTGISALDAPGCVEGRNINILLYGSAAGSGFLFFLLFCCILMICAGYKR